ATVVLLHVLPRSGLDPAVVQRSEAAARTYLDTIVAQIEGAGATAAAVVRVGPTADAIVSEAAQLDAILIVLSVSRRNQFVGAVRPGVADQVAPNATCPVLLVQPEQATRSGSTSQGPLRSFAEDAARAGALTRHHLGVRPIEVARIVGSLDRA